ncbi:carbohydrate ABC transporter permease [Paenibacillus paeoniae]|uniref:Sugar ABC transporter permease n=1 Tax=Paenibacillus paeoniae TaxID=2292705 RepID=A0A371PP24_9BACL|nr:sugar ABC transporter permease [Paenibacillus paeoniae]REK77944.1 sugar ABC transporter permease [Paenibacillus paeoniae]
MQEGKLALPAQAVRAHRVARKSSARVRRWKEVSLGYLFLAPSLVLFAVFLFYPLVKSLYLSLHLTDPRGRIAEYVGFDNFAQLLSSSMFWNSLSVTALFTLLTVPAGIVIGIVTAALTHIKLPGMRGFQFVFSLPLAMSVSTSAVIWMILFHPSLGILNYILQQAGLSPIQWLTDPSMALLSISMMTIWMQSGFNFIMVLSGLQGISEDYIDSAKIDGAGPFRAFVQIVLPLLSPTLFFLTVISIIGSFQAFGQIHLMTKGGPAGSTEVFVYSIYKEAFVNYQYGTGSAFALVLFAIILALTIVQFAFVEKKVHYQ